MAKGGKICHILNGFRSSRMRCEANMTLKCFLAKKSCHSALYRNTTRFTRLEPLRGVCWWRLGLVRVGVIKFVMVSPFIHD